MGVAHSFNFCFICLQFQHGIKGQGFPDFSVLDLFVLLFCCFNFSIWLQIDFGIEEALSVLPTSGLVAAADVPLEG